MTPRHQCLIYDGSPATQLPGLARAISQKLADGARCMYLNSPSMVAGLRSYLSAINVKVEAQIKKGSLILSSDDHCVDGVFDIDRMLGILSDVAQQATSDGYTELFASGDMTWEFGNAKNYPKLFEYECKLEELLGRLPSVSGICQYHRDSLPADVVHSALRTHQGVLLNDTLSRINPHYGPRRARVGTPEEVTDTDVQAMLETIGVPAENGSRSLI